MKLVSDGGIVNCIEGVRLWVLLDGREKLLLICPAPRFSCLLALDDARRNFAGA